MRRIVIEDADTSGRVKLAPAPSPPGGLDLQDWMMLCGLAFWEVAALVIWWPAALLLAGCFCLGFSVLIERSKAKTAKNGDSNP